MTLAVDFARLLEPLDPNDPCGDDLDGAGDLDFLNTVSRVEGLLPESFFIRDKDGRQQLFNREGFNVGRDSKALLALLDRTRDLRLLVLLARLAMLDGDLAGFAGLLSTVAGLLDLQWEAVHPRGDDGDYDLRGAVLQSLDDVPTVILPLQHVVLLQSRRHGPITFRSVRVADQEVPPREDEPVIDRAAILRVLEETDPDAVQPLNAALETILAEADRIGTVTAANGGYANAVRLGGLVDLATRIRVFLASASRKADGDGAGPAARETAGEPGAPALAAPTPGGRIVTAGDASAALAAAALYLRSHEPSSPAEVLVRQAQMLVGKSFIEVMRILMPAQAADAVVAVGANRSLRLTFEQLASVPDDVAEAAGDDGWGTSDAAEEAPSEVSPDVSADLPADPPPAPRGTFRAATRGEAGALLRETGNFFRSHEPSSPIPLLLDKAAGMADRDFLTILRDVLPEDSSD